MEEKLGEIFRVVLELSDDVDVTTVRKIGNQRWDSLATVSIMAAIESEFNIQLGAKDVDRMTSFASVLLLLTERCS